MAGAAAIVTNADIPRLFQEINNELREAPTDPTLVSPKLAWIRTGVMGLETLFTLQLVSNDFLAGKKEPGELATTTLTEFAQFSCGFDEYDPPAYFIASRDMKGDIYKIMEPNLTAVVSRAGIALDQLLAQQIVQNPTTVYDGLRYFIASGTGHPYNPNRTGLGRFFNKFTGVNLDRAGLTKCADFFTQMLSYDGNLTRKPGKRYIVVGSEDQETRARKFLQEGIIASDAGNASESTSLKGKFDDVLLLPELHSVKNGGNKKIWLGAKVSAENDRPFVINAPELPYAYQDGLNPNDVTRVLQRGMRYGVRGTLGAGFLYPQQCVWFEEA